MLFTFGEQMGKGYFRRCFAKNAVCWHREGNAAKVQLKIPWVHVEPLVTTILTWYNSKSAAVLLAKHIACYRCIICFSRWALHTKRVIAFDGRDTFTYLLLICETFQILLVLSQKGMQMALLGPSEMDRILTHLGAPAQQLWSKVDCAGLGGGESRRRKKV